MARKCRIVAAAVTCIGVMGCSNPFVPSGPAVAISFSLESARLAEPVLQTRLDAQRITLSAPPAGGPRAERSVRGPRFGAVPVEVVLLETGGDTLATISFSQDFRRGDNHWIGALVGPRRPEGICLGTLTATPLRTGGSDTLFVMHGGIPEGAIC